MFGQQTVGTFLHMVKVLSNIWQAITASVLNLSARWAVYYNIYFWYFSNLFFLAIIIIFVSITFFKENSTSLEYKYNKPPLGIKMQVQ